ncbi:hypothetical protein AVEN_152906-1 [Araneus ventricosus]|uniref:Uncharacterized protein n=1 Tax=Araneus ventricosus TaxID=182803 RepID=A0A4Y2ACX9_ARAVE|nr:hypothetical protein AVEN_152906-1 [Araneus ventricosus]
MPLLCPFMRCATFSSSGMEGLAFRHREITCLDVRFQTSLNLLGTVLVTVSQPGVEIFGSAKALLREFLNVVKLVKVFSLLSNHCRLFQQDRK